MTTQTENIFKIIETYLFGRYFISMSNGYSPMEGEFNTSEIKLPNLVDLNQCKDILDSVYIERGLIDSKYGYMGTYFIKRISFDVIPHPTIGFVYVPNITISYEFKEIDWENIKQ